MKPLDPRLLKEAKAAKWFIAILVALALLSVVCTIVLAWYLTLFITGLFEHSITFVDSLALLIPVAVAGLLKAFLVGLQELFAVRAASKSKSELRKKLLIAVSNPALLGRFSSAEFAHTFGRGMDALDAYFSKYLPQLVVAVVATALLGLTIVLTDFLSGVILAATLPLIPVFMVLIGLVTRSAQRNQFESLSKLNNHFSQVVRGLTTLRIFNRESSVSAALERAGDQYRSRTMKVLRYSFLSGFALELGASLAVALMAVSIGFRLLWGELDFTTGLFVLLLAPEAFLPLRQLGVQYHAATEGIEASAKAIEMLKFEASADNPVSKLENSASNSKHSKAFLEISKRILNSRGCFLSVSGKSGVGKTTLMKQLSFEFESISVVTSSQRIQLIGDDVRSAITGPIESQEGTLDQKRFDRAIQLAVLDDTPADLQIGLLHKMLSGGQQQRIALARAFYAALATPGSVLLLDEPMSFVDSVRSAKIVGNLRLLAEEGYRVLVVSHQAVVADSSDQNWVISVG